VEPEGGLLKGGCEKKVFISTAKLIYIVKQLKIKEKNAIDVT